MLMMPFDVLWNGCCSPFAPFGSGPLNTTIAAAAAASLIARPALFPAIVVHTPTEAQPEALANLVRTLM